LAFLVGSCLAFCLCIWGLQGCGSSESPKRPTVASSPAANTTIEYYKDIEPLLAAECTSCHSPEGQKLPDLTTYDNVKANIDKIQTTVAATHEGVAAWGDSKKKILTQWKTAGLLPGTSPTPTPSPQVSPSPGAGTPTATPTPAGLSFAKDIEPIFKAKCSSCHGEGKPWSPPLYNLANIKTFRGDITACMSTDANHGAVMTKEELSAFRAWVAAGMPE
jgi:mono/diheme cytochrome c family protein